MFIFMTKTITTPCVFPFLDLKQFIDVLTSLKIMLNNMTVTHFHQQSQ